MPGEILTSSLVDLMEWRYVNELTQTFYQNYIEIFWAFYIEYHKTNCRAIKTVSHFSITFEVHQISFDFPSVVFDLKIENAGCTKTKSFQFILIHKPNWLIINSKSNYTANIIKEFPTWIGKSRESMYSTSI